MSPVFHLTLLLLLSTGAGCSLAAGPRRSQIAGTWTVVSGVISRSDETTGSPVEKIRGDGEAALVIQQTGAIDFSQSPLCIYWPPGTYKVRLIHRGDSFVVPSAGNGSPPLTIHVTNAEYSPESSHVGLRIQRGSEEQQVEYRMSLRRDGDLDLWKSDTPSHTVETYVLRRLGP